MSLRNAPIAVAVTAALAVVISIMAVPSRNEAAPSPSPPAHVAPEREAPPEIEPEPVVAEVESFSYSPIDLAQEPVEPLPTDVEEFFEDYLEIDYVPARIELGRRLFHDTRLSSDDTISCASCHDLRYAGIDRAITATGIRGQIGPINTPTVFNASLHTAQFWDGRADSLEDQANGPPNAPGEMGSNWEEITGKLVRDESIMELLREAYPDESFEEGPEPAHWLLAIADFERTLITPDAPFDRYLSGDDSAVSQAVKEGYQVFKDVGCYECHSGAAIGARSYQRLGRRRAYRFQDNADVHLGRFNVTQRDEDRHVFKVSSLRNVALTAPYFHDGSIDELDEVVRQMGRLQLDVELSDGQVGRLVAFLNSLTGHYEGRPLCQHQNTPRHPATPVR